MVKREEILSYILALIFFVFCWFNTKSVFSHDPISIFLFIFFTLFGTLAIARPSRFLPGVPFSMFGEVSGYRKLLFLLAATFFIGFGLYYKDLFTLNLMNIIFLLIFILGIDSLIKPREVRSWLERSSFNHSIFVFVMFMALYLVIFYPPGRFLYCIPSSYRTWLWDLFNLTCY